MTLQDIKSDRADCWRSRIQQKTRKKPLFEMAPADEAVIDAATALPRKVRGIT
ncbi:MAG: hypothetical protein LLG15_11990 [Betaproteobacteria bacterium]|nr:hypothetical protein [Betaproteobacteria bacterium]